LLRCMDLYARTDEQQRLVRQELKRYAERVVPVLYGRGKQLPRGANVYLVTSTTQLHLPPTKLTRLPDVAESDVLVMPLDAFLAGINRDLKLAKRVVEMGAGKGKLLMTERRFNEISQGTAVIRRSLQSVSRKNARHRIEGIRALLDVQLSDAFDHFSGHGPCLTDKMLNDAEKRLAWSVVNVSETGAALQRMGHAWQEIQCGALVGARWIGERVGSGLAVVRWFRESKPGEQSIGIEFVGGTLQATRGMLVGDQSAPMSRRCSLLYDPAEPKRVWFPYVKMEVGSKLIYLFEGEGIRCHVAKVLRSGPNFTCCELAFESIDGKYFSVQAESLL